MSLSMAGWCAFAFERKWKQESWCCSSYGYRPARDGAALRAPAAKPKSGKSTKECMICGERSTTQCSSQECSSRQASGRSSGQTNLKPPYCCESCIRRMDGMKPLCKTCFAHKSLSMKLFVCKHCNIETTSGERCSSDACSNTVCCSKCLVVSRGVNFAQIAIL